MADEITIQIRISGTKNGATVAYAPAPDKVDMAGNEMVNKTQNIGTSSETIDLGEISAAPGTLVIRNTDLTNFVEVGGDSGLTVWKLKILPGREVIISPTSATLYAKADTSPVSIQVVAFDL
jgi:hypothetical protein